MQVGKAATLIGGLPTHNFELADSESLAAKHRSIDDYYIPSTLKTKELVQTFNQRKQIYYKSIDESQLFANIIGNPNWGTWLQVVHELSASQSPIYYKDDLGKYERALYGALSGNLSAVQRMCSTWHDRLWAHFKSAFTLGVLKQFLAKWPDYEILFQGQPQSDALPSLPFDAPELHDLALIHEEPTSVPYIFTNICRCL